MVDEEVAAEAADARLAGRLAIPAGARGVVLFVHGSGSSRHSPRNRYVASELVNVGLGTLLFDLLTPTRSSTAGTSSTSSSSRDGSST